ncbi:MAG: hypothetical protein KU38_07395 [Sulfurovum sp. FS08-3]|nr:MAG: hypothetical protein KU38_07395 [Sulfurovum sp. FS08-3]
MIQRNNYTIQTQQFQFGNIGLFSIPIGLNTISQKNSRILYPKFGRLGFLVEFSIIGKSIA